jgi:Mg-chelatase subunit ChlI
MHLIGGLLPEAGSIVNITPATLKGRIALSVFVHSTRVKILEPEEKFSIDQQVEQYGAVPDAILSTMAKLPIRY